MTKNYYYQSTLLYSADDHLECEVLITTKDFEKAKNALLNAYKEEIDKVDPKFLETASDKEIEDFYLNNEDGFLEWHDIYCTREDVSYQSYEFDSMVKYLWTKGFINLIIIDHA